MLVKEFVVGFIFELISSVRRNVSSSLIYIPFSVPLLCHQDFLKRAHTLILLKNKVSQATHSNIHGQYVGDNLKNLADKISFEANHFTTFGLYDFILKIVDGVKMIESNEIVINGL